MTDKRKALGRGLETLLPSRTATQPPTAAPSSSAVAPAHDSGEAVHELPVELIDPNPYQTRSYVRGPALDELAASIAMSGVLQPVTVRPVAEGRFQLIAGQRRLSASKQAGRTTIPAIVRQVSNEQAAEMTIIENLQRLDLNPIDQARGFERLGREFNLTQEEMAQRTGKDRATVSNFLRLLKLPQDVQTMLEHGHMSFGHAKALLTLDNPNTILTIGYKVYKDALSVRQTEDYVAELLQRNPKPKKEQRPADPHVKEAERRIRAALGMSVTIRDKRGRGKVVIAYNSLEDFDRIMEALEKG